jgi:succinate-semialdehyde dehydrogenase/glutarate-semialdehyde dehydrogenase
VSQVKSTINQGAKVLYGDLNYRMTEPSLKDGFYFHPMVLDNIPKSSPAYCEELFGPVFSLFKFQNGFEAVSISNDSVYGLSAAIFTKDRKRAERKAMMLDVGQVFINDSVTSDPGIPSGGIKESGYGRECFKEGLLEVSNRKSIIFGSKL